MTGMTLNICEALWVDCSVCEPEGGCVSRLHSGTPDSNVISFRVTREIKRSVDFTCDTTWEVYQEVFPEQ